MMFKQIKQQNGGWSNEKEIHKKDVNSSNSEIQNEDEKYFILESQIGDRKWSKSYKCQMNDKNMKIGFVKQYNKNEIEASDNGVSVIERIHHSIDVLQNFQRSSYKWIPQLLSKNEDSDSIEVITEYIQDNISDMIEQQQIYSENDAIFLIKCILMNLHEIHHIKNVFNAKECYLNIGINTKSLLFIPSSSLEKDAKDNIVFSNTGDLYQEDDLQKKGVKEIENLIKLNDYSAPETLKHKKITMQSNLWSVGCIFYQMLFNEKFIQIDPQSASTKAGVTEYYQQMRFSSETLRSNLICKSNNISNFSIQCLQGLLQFHENDRFTWESVKKHIFSLELTKSIDDYDLKSISHSYVSNNSLWASRTRPAFGTTNSTKKNSQNSNTSNIYLSFTDNSVIIEGDNSQNQKYLNKSMIKQSFIENNNYVSQNNKQKKEDFDNLLKESFMNGIMKKSLLNGDSDENTQIQYMQKSKIQQSKQHSHILQSFALNINEGNCTQGIDNSQLNNNDSFTEAFLDDEEDKPNIQANPRYKQEQNKYKMNQSINNKSKIAKNNSNNKSDIYKYQLQIPKYSELQEIQQKQNNQAQLKMSDKSQDNQIQNNSYVADNQSLFKHIEQHKINQQKYSSLLDQYESAQKSESNTLTNSREFPESDFLDQLMAQRGGFNPNIDFNSEHSNLSSNRSNVKEQQLNGKIQMYNLKNNKSEISKTQKINIIPAEMSINDLSSSPYNKGTVKMNNNQTNHSIKLDSSSFKTIQISNPNSQKSKVISESRNERSYNGQCQTKNKNLNSNPLIVYSVTPTPNESQINYYNVPKVEQAQANHSSQREGGNLYEVQSQFINASDLKNRLDQNPVDNQSGRFIFDEQPIEGLDISECERQYQTPQHQYMVFDELVSNDELACSYMLNTKTRKKMGIDLDHLQRVFSGEAQYDVQGNQSFTSARGYEKQVFYDKQNQVVVKKERKSSLVHSQTVKQVNPPIQTLNDIILQNQYKIFSKNEELFIFSSFFDPFEFKIQTYFQTVLQKTEDIFKHFNNEECLNCVIVILSLFRVRLFNLIFKKLTEEAHKNQRNIVSNNSSSSDKNNERDQDQLTQSIKQEMKEKVTQDKNIKNLDNLIVQFLKRSTLKDNRDLVEPQIYTIYRKHIFNFYNFLTKKIYDSQNENKNELKLPFDRLIQMSRLAYHILIISHYQKTFKLYFKELFTQKQNNDITNLFQFVEEKISFMDLYQLQSARNNLKQFLNIKVNLPQALPSSISPNRSNNQLVQLPPQPTNNNNIGKKNKTSILA